MIKENQTTPKKLADGDCSTASCSPVISKTDFEVLWRVFVEHPQNRRKSNDLSLVDDCSPRLRKALLDAEKSGECLALSVPSF